MQFDCLVSNWANDFYELPLQNSVLCLSIRCCVNGLRIAFIEPDPHPLVPVQLLMTRHHTLPATAEKKRTRHPRLPSIPRFTFKPRHSDVNLGYICGQDLKECQEAKQMYSASHFRAGFSSNEERH